MPIVEPSGASGGGSQPIQMGVVSPIGIVTPNLPTQPLYCDATHGALYIAVGPASADWIILGGVDNGDPRINQAVGINYYGGGLNGGIGIIGGGHQGGATGTGGVFMQDQASALDTDNGIYWSGGDAAGVAQMITGSGGQYVGAQGTDGKFKPATTIDPSNFPTADPADGGKSLWNNLGIITVST